MTNRGVAIRYGDVAPEAKENFNASASESEFNTLAQLKEYNLNFPNFANPCELYQTILDGTATALPSNPESSNLGLWSEQVSNEDGIFNEPIVLTLTSEGQYTSQGLTFTFDTHNNIYPTLINVHWWRDLEGVSTDLGEEDFTPDNAFYFCQKRVDNYNRVVITFYSLNMPNNRLKLRVIDYGHGTIFYGNELRGVKLIQEIDPISTQISINTADFTLDSKSDIEYSFQAKQPLSVYFNGQLKATTFVRKSTRKSKRLWSVQSEDYIGLLDSISYYGGIYNDSNAVGIIEDIFRVAKVPYSIDEAFANTTVTGYIPYTTCRKALMQVAFAIQAVVDTSDSDVVKVFSLGEEVEQTIPLNRIMQGQDFDEEETVTGVEIAVHNYEPVEQTVDVYKASESGTGSNIFVKFSEPLHSLTITNGTIVNVRATYAVINAEEGCVLTGKRYEHTTQTRRRNNPLVLASDIEKVVTIENATLVSASNIDILLDKCYNYIVRTSAVNARIIEGKHVSGGEVVRYGGAKYGTVRYFGKTPVNITYDKPVKVGDIIITQTEYKGNIEGRVVKQTFNLNGGIIVKDCVIK